jgi:RNA polymerase sigma-70 factor (ECF subfamily)
MDFFTEEIESENFIGGTEIEIMLQKAILQLPLKQRMVFNMRYFDDMTYEAIAEILETSVNTLKVNYHHAKTKIEELIKHQIE